MCPLQYRQILSIKNTILSIKQRREQSYIKINSMGSSQGKSSVVGETIAAIPQMLGLGSNTKNILQQQIMKRRQTQENQFMKTKISGLEQQLQTMKMVMVVAGKNSHQERQRQKQLQQMRLKKKELENQLAGNNQEMAEKHSHLIKREATLQDKIKKLESDNPKLQRNIDELQKNQKDMMKQITSVEELQAMRELHLSKYIEYIKTVQFETNALAEYGRFNYIVVGNISVGKSSLLNSFFGLQLDTGISDFTNEAKPVLQGPVTLWDSPGVDQDFDLMNVGILHALASMDKIFILYNTSLKSSKNEVRILSALKPGNVICIRTMCDRFRSESELKDILKTDGEVLAKWGLKLPIFAVSAQSSMPDNEIVRKMMYT